MEILFSTNCYSKCGLKKVTFRGMIEFTIHRPMLKEPSTDLHQKRGIGYNTKRQATRRNTEQRNIKILEKVSKY
jgi:hypothetical protein